MSDIDELIDALQQTNFNQAKNHFDNLMSDRVNNAIEAEKIAVASHIFNDGDDLPDEEIEELEDEAEVEDEGESEEDSNS